MLEEVRTGVGCSPGTVPSIPLGGFTFMKTSHLCEDPTESGIQVTSASWATQTPFPDLFSLGA